MNKLETGLIWLFVGFTCPFLLFVIFWWSAAILHSYCQDFPLKWVIIMSFSGLSTGLILDAFFLRHWVSRFYTINLWLMGLIYLGLSIAAVAFFMGLPVGTIILGTLAGIYMGRRARHAQAFLTKVTQTLRKTSVAAGAVTAMAAFPIGLLALGEKDILEMLHRLLGIQQASIQGWAGFVLVSLLCLLLFLIQYWLSKLAGHMAYNAGRGNT